MFFVPPLDVDDTLWFEATLEIDNELEFTIHSAQFNWGYSPDFEQSWEFTHETFKLIGYGENSLKRPYYTDTVWLEYRDACYSDVSLEIAIPAEIWHKALGDFERSVRQHFDHAAKRLSILEPWLKKDLPS